MGSSVGDRVGLDVTALTNGNYVVRSPFWDSGGIVNAGLGAVTWGNGNTGITGVVSAANSLVGSSVGDVVGDGVTALTNGNYVVRSSRWDNGGIANVGAATWGNGNTGITGVVSPTNSLVGSSANDGVGYGVTALTNGNYVVSSRFWNNGGIQPVGAVTWGNGNTGITGVVGAANSLVGSSVGDLVGGISSIVTEPISGIVALTNGNYVVSSPSWDNGGIVDAGAVTWGDGNTGITGVVSASNSLVGSSAFDYVGLVGLDRVTALTNGNYVVRSSEWGIANVGAVTWGNGNTGITGVVSASNSLVGSSAFDLVGFRQIEEDVVNNTFLTHARNGSLGSGAVLVGFRDNSPNNLSFVRMQGQDLTTTTRFLSDTLNTGTAVTLQANNDFTLNSPLSLNNPIRNGGDLTVQAGRSILINADITTDNGNLTLSANDINALGAYRDPGSGSILINNGATINTGTGNFSATLGTGASSGIAFASGTSLLGNTFTLNSASNLLLSTLSATGNFTATTAGNISQTGTLNIAGSTTLSSQGDITLNNAGNDFNTVAVSSANANNVVLKDANDLNLGTANIRGNLTVEAQGSIQNTLGSLTIGGNASFTSSLANAGSVLFNSTKPTGTTTLANSLIGGNFTLTSLTPITKAPGSLLQVAGDILVNGTNRNDLNDVGQVGTTTTLPNGDVVITQTGTISLPGGVYGGNLTVNSLPTAVLGFNEVLTPTAISLSNANIGGTVAFQTTLGDADIITGIPGITQSAPLQVANTATFNAGTGNLSLTDPNNQFTNLGFTGHDIALRNRQATNLLTSTASGNFSLASAGAITQTGVLDIAGTTTLTTAAPFAGNVSLTNTLPTAFDTTLIGGNLSLTSPNPITQVPGSIFQVASSVNFDITGFNTDATAPRRVDFNNNVIITQVGTVSLNEAAILGNLTVNSLGEAYTFRPETLNQYNTSNAIVLDQGNRFQGALSLRTDADLILQKSDIPGIIQNAPLSVGGTTQLNAIGGNITLLDSNNQFNRLGFVGDNVALRSQTNTLLTTSTAAGNLAVSTGGTLSQLGSLQVGGTGTFSSNTGQILLTGSNSFQDTLSFTTLANTGGNVSLTNTLAETKLGTSRIQGDFTLNAGSSVSQSGPLTVTGLTQLNGGNQILTLDAANDFATVALRGSRQVTLYDINDLTLAGSTVYGSLTATAVGNLSARNLFSPGGNLNLISQRGNIDTRGGQITTSDRLRGGDVNLTALGDINLGSVVTLGQETTAGNITVTSHQGQITVQGSDVTSLARNQARAGNMTFRADAIELRDGARLIASTAGTGDAGQIDLTAATFLAQGLSGSGVRTGVFSQVESSARANGGGITLNASESVTLLDGAILDATTYGNGDSGLISVTTSTFFAQGAPFPNSDRRTGLWSQVYYGATGTAKGIVLNASDSIQLLDGGVIDTSTYGLGNAGLIEVTTNTFLSDGTSSGIFSLVGSPAVGDSKGITIDTGSLFLENAAQITTSTLGKGDAGAIDITATRAISLTGESGIYSGVASGAEGASRGITIDTGSLSLADGAAITASTFGRGDAGAIDITATRAISLTGESGIYSTVGSGAEGKSGGITIDTGSLSLEDGAAITASTFGRGDAGAIDITATGSISMTGQDSQGFISGLFSTVGSGAEGKSGGITIDTGSLSLAGGAILNASTSGKGNAGAIRIEAAGAVSLSGLDRDGVGSGIFSVVNPGAVGAAGGITLEAGGLSLNDGAAITASTLGRGNAGNVLIRVSDFVTLAGESSIGFASAIGSTVESGAEGSSGILRVETGRLSLTDGAIISASTSGKGNAGAVQIQATDSVTLQGQTKAGEGSQILSQVKNTATGNANEISITAPQLTLLDGAVIAADTAGSGNARSIIVNASDSISLGSQTRLSVETSSSGTPGDIAVTTPRLSIGEDAQLSATVTATSSNTEGGGNITLNISDLDITGRLGIFAETNSLAQAGNLVIQPNGTDPNLDITFTNNGFISASTTASGNGGSITLSAPAAIDIQGEGSIAVTTSGSGTAGNIQFTTPQLNLSDGVTVSGSTTGTGTGGTISVRTADRFTLTNARLETLTEGSGDAGNINLDLGRSLFITGENAGIFVTSEANATGNSGRITIQQLDGITDAFNVELTQGATLSASTAGQANAGSIQLQDIDTLKLDGGIISTEITETGQSTEQSNIEIDAETLTLDNGSTITADTQGVGDAGNIDLSTVQELTIAGDSRISSSTSGQGNSGTIDLSGTQTITGTGGTISTAVLAGGQGQGGSITIATDTLNLTDTDITSSTAGEGDTGTIAITARRGVTLDQNSEISTAVKSGATGNAQQIDLFTPQLSLNQSQITASTSGTGNAGRINLTGIDGVSTQQIGLSNNSAITTAVNTGATGNAGQINLNTRQLTLTTGSQIASSSNGQGRAGRITAQNADRITLDNSTISTEITENATAETLNQNDRGNITLSAQALSLDNGSTITARTAGFRETGFNDAGKIDLTTTTTLNNGSAIQTNTAGSGTAGDINLIATEGLFLTGTNSGIFSSTEEGSTGNAGNITIDPPIVDIRDGAGVAVNSLGSGIGGNITLFAGDLTLTNNAFISALTRSSSGGNIDLSINNNLILSNNSFISTEAGTAQAGGDGGNITLSSFFTIGRNNSDIIANAFEGNGGSINITTQGLFGFTVKNVDNPRQDSRNNITASSRFGSSGTTNINATVDPAQGLGTLPGNLVDPSSLIDRRCDLARTPNASRFVILGKGGLPATARDLLGFAPLWTDLDLATPVRIDSTPPTPLQTLPPLSPSPDDLRSTLNSGEPLYLSRAIGLTQFLFNRCSN